MKKAFLIFASFSIFLSCSKTPEPVTPPDKIKLVETSLIPIVYIEGDSTWTIEERMEHYGVPGVSIAVINNYQIEWVKSYGVMDKETQIPVTDKTLFQAGSISKPVAAYGALKMVEQDKISLDEDINTYLQSWKLPDSDFTKEKKVALKHLVSHTGGLTVHGFWGYSPDLPVPSLLEVLNGTPPANSAPIFVDKTPEESFRYSGGGYTIMQQMMIDVEQKTFPYLMHTLVLDPLGMNNSTYDQPLKEEQLKMAATGYLPNGDMTKGKRHTYPEMAAAGLWTTAEDLAKFAINLQQSAKGENNTILSQDMANKMLTPFIEDHIGLGIFISDLNGEIYFGHGGWDEGFSSELKAHKDKGYGVVVLTNSNHPRFISELIQSVALTYKWDNYVPIFKKINTTEAELEQVIGRYRLNKDRLTKVYHKGNQLYKKSMGEKPLELVKVSDSTFVSRDSDRQIQFKVNTETGLMNALIIHPDTREIGTSLTRMTEDEKLPIEFLEAGDYDKGLQAYKELKTTEPEAQAVQENNINRLGYQLLNNDQVKLAIDVFKVNVALYPESFNVYDSYAEASMINEDWDVAIENYKKSFALNPENTNASKMIEKIENEKKNKKVVPIP